MRSSGRCGSARDRIVDVRQDGREDPARIGTACSRHGAFAPKVAKIAKNANAGGVGWLAGLRRGAGGRRPYPPYPYERDPASSRKRASKWMAAAMSSWSAISLTVWT